LLGEVQGLSGHTQEAIESYHRAYALNPDNVALTNNLAFLMAENGGNLDEALRLAQQAVQRLPDQPNFADTLGYVYLKKNLNDSAIQVFRGLAKKYPNDSSFHYHFGLALMQTGDKARARLELATALSGNPPADLRRKIETAIAKIS
jgi:Flp pilus assembly protein TadD